MRAVYLIARLYPYWALPVAFLIAEMGRHFRRKGQDYQYYCWFWSGFLVFLIFLWIGFRGDLHSDDWVRAVFGS